MVDRSTPCPDCGSSAVLTIGQSIEGARLVWFQSTRCGSCGMAMEADDWGLPPEDVRGQMINSGGRWGLHVTAEGPRRVEACKILHCDLATTMEEVEPMKQRMPGIVYTGTKAEMEWLCHRLSLFEINSNVLPQNDSDHARSIDIGTFATRIIDNAKRR